MHGECTHKWTMSQGIHILMHAKLKAHLGFVTCIPFMELIIIPPLATYKLHNSNRAGWFTSFLLTNSEDRFSRVGVDLYWIQYIFVNEMSFDSKLSFSAQPSFITKWIKLK